MAENNYYRRDKSKPHFISKDDKKLKQEKDRSAKLILLNTLVGISLFALILALAGYLHEKLLSVAAETSYQEVAQEAVLPATHEINFSVVKSAGANSTSWIYIPNTNIDYPLVQGDDNDFYIDNDAYGNPSSAGAIFINFANSSDMSDAKTIIFGHNMASGSMFSDLHKYSDRKWGEEHTDAYIYMENGSVKHYKLRYYIFTEPMDPDVYVVSKSDVASEEAEKLKGASSLVYGEHSGGNLIVLSTCTMHTYRTVIVFEYVNNNKPIIGSVSQEKDT